ncbi:MAG TPA: D-alanyl-D-alanine carboxypeptidase/D-alanyl-D-alanine-endopeptidase [Ilumatobacter sp.]|nr:D-alanyl-D-alanine carboxypeptidase/D-alanyl-D-alanine-endopeptidase [Ilumatobacter sp.]
MSPSRRRNSRAPLVALGIVALVPALALWGVWQWADGQSAAAADGVPPADPAAPAPPAATPALTTGLTSLRRAAPMLSRQLNLGAFQQAVTPVLDMVGERSCAAISLDGELVGERNVDTITIPASTQKVLVAAVALDVLGADFTYTTELMAPEPQGGVITGDVYLVGSGDPLLSGAWYEGSTLDANPAFNTTLIDDLAEQLSGKGVREIRGVVRGDGSRYDDEWYVDTWGPGVAGGEAGPYDALLVNDSRVLGDEYRGSDPNESGARELIRILGERGIGVSGGAGTGTWSAGTGTSQIAAVTSQPLPAILEEMLTNSDNNTAEMVVKELGVAAGGAGTRQAGLDVMAATIAGWGVDTTGLELADGSGLSLSNRVSCTTMLGVLQHAGADSAVALGLAVAGQTGTMTPHFADTPLDGRLLGKTGTLSNPPFDQDPPASKALAGYLPVDGGGAIEFVLILNGDPGGLPITEQNAYRPVWAALGTALASFPAVAGPAELGPR